MALRFWCEYCFVALASLAIEPNETREEDNFHLYAVLLLLEI